MQAISALEMRKDLSGVCQRVMGGETLVLRVHGVDVLGMVTLEWAQFCEKIAEIDEVLRSVNPQLQFIMRKIIVDTLHWYAELLKKGNESIKINDLVRKIGDDLHTILMGERRKSELNIG